MNLPSCQLLGQCSAVDGAVTGHPVFFSGYIQLQALCTSGHDFERWCSGLFSVAMPGISKVRKEDFFSFRMTSGTVCSFLYVQGGS